MGDDMTMAVQKGGLASAWGNNTAEALATGASSQYPLRMHGLGSVGTFDDAEVVAMGQNHGCAIRQSGQPVCWGEDDNGRCGENDGVNVNLSAPTPVVGAAGYTEIDGGDAYSCGLLSSGAVACWGYSGQGEIGDGSSNQRLTTTDAAGGRGFTEIDSAVAHACAVTGTGDVYCWGYNGNGALGIGSTEERWAPAKVPGLAPASDVAALQYGSCAVLVNGTVQCWGYDAEGENGDGTLSNPVNRTSPAPAVNLTNVVEIAGGLLHACALVDPPPVGDGNTQVWCWGYNVFGQLGNTLTANSPTPVQVHGVGNVGMLTDAVALGSGWYHNCATRSNGEIVCWGRGDLGEIGDGANQNRTSPVTVKGVGGTGNLTGMAGGRHVIDGSAENTCALAASGKAFCWGNAANGENGANNVTSTNLPVQVAGALDDFKRISVWSDPLGHACAVRAGGEVWCWGWNGYGQLGDGTVTERHAPARALVAEASSAFGNTNFASPVIAVTTGQYHTLAVHQNGSISAWGLGGNGRLGDGRVEQQNFPVAVATSPKN
jgi:alpha-tubulin suppressor-like RCC1 family protein